MSCGVASAVGSQPSSRRVALVTGPMEMALTPANGKRMPAARATSARWMALEELAKVAASIADGEGCAQLIGCGGRDRVLVGVDNVDGRTGFAQCIGDDVASDGGARQQNALSLNAGGQRGDKALGNVAFGCEGDVESSVAGCFGGGRSDGGDVRRRIVKRKLEACGSLSNCANGVGTGEDEPVVSVEVPERHIERIVAGGRTDFEDGDFDGIGACSAKAFAEFAGLVRGAGYEDASVGQR